MIDWNMDWNKRWTLKAWFNPVFRELEEDEEIIGSVVDYFNSIYFVLFSVIGLCALIIIGCLFVWWNPYILDDEKLFISIFVLLYIACMSYWSFVALKSKDLVLTNKRVFFHCMKGARKKFKYIYDDGRVTPYAIFTLDEIQNIYVNPGFLSNYFDVGAIVIEPSESSHLFLKARLFFRSSCPVIKKISIDILNPFEFQTLLYDTKNKYCKNKAATK